MKPIALIKSTLAAAAALLLGVSQASAQISPPEGTLPAALEGTISAITLNDDGSVSMTVMGMPVSVPVGTPVTSPTAELTLSQLVDPTPLPGRTLPGFLGGTAIINGNATPEGIVTATDVFVEPSENVAIGAVTANTGTQISVNGTPVVLLEDPRIPAGPVKDANGIEILLSSIPVGTGAAIEGYYSEGTFYAFLIEADQGTPVNIQPQVVITRALGRERTPNNRRGDEVEVRGTCTIPHAPTATTQDIRVFRVDSGVETLLGTGTAIVDPAVPGIAAFTFRTVTAPSTSPVLGVCPTTVRVVNISAGANNASATASVEVR